MKDLQISKLVYEMYLLRKTPIDAWEIRVLNMKLAKLGIIYVLLSDKEIDAYIAEYFLLGANGEI